jgi:hypothetical protein
MDWLPPERSVLAWTAGALVAAVALVPEPATVAAGGVVAAVMALVSRSVPEREGAARTLSQVVSFVGLTVLGCGVAVGAGAAVDRVAAIGFGLVAWHSAVWWVVQSQVMRAIPTREVPRWATWVPVVVLPACLIAANGLGYSWVGLVPFGAPLRALAHDPLRGSRDLARVGWEDLGWSVAAAVTMVALS